MQIPICDNKNNSKLVEIKRLFVDVNESPKGLKMNKEFNRKIGERINKELANQGLTQSYLADELDVEQSTVNKYVNGNTGLSLEKAVQIAEILGTGLDYLVYGETKRTRLVNFILKSLKELVSEIEKRCK